MRRHWSFIVIGIGIIFFYYFYYSHVPVKRTSYQLCPTHKQSAIQGQQFLRNLYLVDSMPSYNDFENTVRNIMYALYCYAYDRDTWFVNGTFVLSDDYDNRLFYYLVRSKFVYKRPSSHYQEYGVSQYGLDIEQLPFSKQHLLFGKLPGGRLFIKPERYGLRYHQLPGHAIDWLQSRIRKNKTLQGFFGSDSDDRPIYRKEHTPSAILNQALALLDRLEPDKKKRDNKCRVMKRFGINAIIALLYEYEYDKEANRFIEQLQCRYPDWNIRKGNEIIIPITQFLSWRV